MDKDEQEDIEAQISLLKTITEDLEDMISTYGTISSESLEVMRHVIDAIRELNYAKCKLLLLKD